MNDIEISKIDILELLLQRPPFVMVDQLTAWSEKSADTTFEVRQDNILCRDGHLQLGGLIENIAQTSAARIGYYYKYVLRKPVQVGFIGAIRDLKVMQLPEVGEVLTTHLDVLVEAFGMSAIKATVRGSKSGVCAVGEMKTSLGN